MREKIDDEIKRLENINPQTDPNEIFHALEIAIQLIKELKDETESTWAMLEEQKSSEIKMHSELLKKEIDKKIIDTLSLIKTKPVLA